MERARDAGATVPRDGNWGPVAGSQPRASVSSSSDLDRLSLSELRAQMDQWTMKAVRSLGESF